MTKLKLKKLWKILGKFFKNNWGWVVGIGTMIGFGVYFSTRAGSFKEVAKQFSILNQKRKNDHKNAVKKRAEEIEKRTEVINELSKALEKIEEKYDDKRRKLKKEKKEKIQKVAEKNEADPESFAKKLAEEYDLEYVEEK